MLQPINDQDSGYGELLEPPPSLWSQVEGQVPRSERAEIKRILGEAAIDLSLDLHAEIEALLDLWRDISSTCPSAIQSPASSRCSILVDPPVIKDMVTQEIQMLLLSVRMKARHQGLDEDQALSKYNPKVLSFVMGTQRLESRATSRESRLSRPPSGCRCVNERPFSSLSTRSSIEDDLDELKDKLQISDIDEVILHLRSLLEDECRMLQKDIIILQQRLEEERQYVEEVQALQAEPSLTELKEERRLLERDLKLNQLPATSYQKMASNRKGNATRLLDFGESATCRLSPEMSSSSDLQHDGSKTPRSPDPKLKISVGRLEGKGLTGPGATSCAATSPVPGPQELGLRAAHRSLETISRVHSPPCDRERGPVQDFHVTSDTLVPTAPGTPLKTLIVPLPPKVQRPPGSSGQAPVFRRVRTRVMNLPP